LAEIPIYTKTQIVEQVNGFLSKRNPNGIIPVPIEPMIEKYGIEIYPVPDFQNSSGNLSAALDNDLCSITIAENTSDGHYRYLLAHELGHLILHREFIGSLQLTSSHPLLTWRKQLLEFDSEIYKDLERQADRFARYCLMPDEPFGRFKYSAEMKFQAGMNWDILPEQAYQAACGWLADQFRTTKSSADRRLMDFGIQRM